MTGRAIALERLRRRPRRPSSGRAAYTAVSGVVALAWIGRAALGLASGDWLFALVLPIWLFAYPFWRWMHREYRRLEAAGDHPRPVRAFEWGFLALEALCLAYSVTIR